VAASAAADSAVAVAGWLAMGAGRPAGGTTQSAGNARRLGGDGRQPAGGARRFAGFPAVGALFTVADGQLVHHFCTGSVVDSPAADLVITAAHCVGRLSPGQVAFVPGYRDGAEPYGAWTVSAIYTDTRWRASASPNHDVAFLVVHRNASGREIQQVTGGQRLGTGWRARVAVHVVGYPDRADSAIICRRHTHAFGRRQLKVVCGGFTDGTSGGPFLAKLNTTTGEGTVIGVIGGYEQGGELAWVSYSARFGRAVRALYRAASNQAAPASQPPPGPPQPPGPPPAGARSSRHP
jgi:V8-like Glu-specific endopeptidase